MTHFISEDGLFEMFIPETWKYDYSVSNDIHMFLDRDGIMNFSIKISVKPLVVSNPKPIGIAIEINDQKYRLLKTDSSTIIVLIKENKIITFSLDYDEIHLGVRNEHGGRKPPESLFQDFIDAISTFELIPESTREINQKGYRYMQFIKGLGASKKLLYESFESRAFLQMTCLSATFIDACLRLSIILKQQLDQNNHVIDDKWIFQGENHKAIHETKVFEEAKRLNIITVDLFESLSSLHKERNKAIHRFIISGITWAEVEQIARWYFNQIENVERILESIENEQIKQGVGIVGISALNRAQNSWNIQPAFFNAKFGKSSYQGFEKPFQE